MKLVYSVPFCLFQFFLISYMTWACDNDDSWRHPISEVDDFRDESFSDGVFEQRTLSGLMVEKCGYLTPSIEEMEEDAVNMRAWKVKQLTQNIFARSDKLYTIPVYFHIIQTSSNSGIVSDTRIGEYVSYLNSAYAGSSAPFTFVSKGVTRTIQSEWGKCNDYETEIAMKKQLKVGGADTLNVYICNSMYTEKGASLTGFATRPYAKSGTDPRDGVVIDNSSSKGRLNTLVHEVGHFLGLLHTFGDNTCNADSKGDFVDDTPQHLSRASTVNCKSDPDTWDTCPLLPGIDPVDNYMTYSIDNSCRTRFTLGQNNRMLAQYELYRMPKSSVPIPTPVAPRPKPSPTPVSKPVPRAIPVAPRPVPTPVVRPLLFSPRPPAPIAPRQPIFAPREPYPSPTTPPKTQCAAMLARCTNDSMCCSGFCQPARGIFSIIIAARCL